MLLSLSPAKYSRSSNTIVSIKVNKFVHYTELWFEPSNMRNIPNMHDMVICDQAQPLEYPQLGRRQGHENAFQARWPDHRPHTNLWVIRGEVSNVPRPNRMVWGVRRREVLIVRPGFGDSYLA